MSDEKNEAEPSGASGGSGATIDAHELVRRLRNISLDEWYDLDVRRSARDAKCAIEMLSEWVNKLQINASERVTLERLSDSRFRTHGISLTAGDSDTLRGLLDRHN